MTEVNVNSVIEGYVKLRDKKAELRKKYKEKESELQGKMDKMEAYLLSKMQGQGANQLGSDHGTAYQQTKLKGSCSDWGGFWDWAADNKRLDMLEKRISIKVLQEYFEESGELPPGVNIHQELKVVIRRT